MKKHTSATALAKAAIIFVFAAFASTACQTASLSSVETTQTAPTQTPATQTNSAANAAHNAAPTATPDDGIDRPRSEPYTGDLSIFEDANRAKNLQIDRVMDILKIAEGKSVADIGAGSGWFTTRAAKRVGANGRVYAVEINQEYINYIDDRAKKENFANIQTILGTENDPKLPAASIDAVLILKTYHEIGQPVRVLRNIKRALKKDALLGIIDKNGKGDDHGINKNKVVEEAKRAGFQLKEEYDFTKADGMDYFLVFSAAE